MFKASFSSQEVWSSLLVSLYLKSHWFLSTHGPELSSLLYSAFQRSHLQLSKHHLPTANSFPRSRPSLVLTFAG